MAKAICSIEGCDHLEKARGWCSKHYERWRTFGTPDRAPERNPRTVTPNGYVRVREPSHPLADGNGYVLEHRKVVYDAGIDADGMDVHHKNRDRTDNRLENLAVMTHADHMRLHAEERQREAARVRLGRS